MKILMIDNYDSFTYNLVHLFEQLGAEVVTFRNDALSVDEPSRSGPTGSSSRPARGAPTTRAHRWSWCGGSARRRLRSGSASAIRRSSRRTAARSGRRSALLHGKASRITHDGHGVFEGLPEEVEVGRYHSLAATVVPDVLQVTARTGDGEVMGVRHVDHPVEGVQFHPESVLTPLGARMAENFLS